MGFADGRGERVLSAMPGKAGPWGRAVPKLVPVEALGDLNDHREHLEVLCMRNYAILVLNKGWVLLPRHGQTTAASLTG